MEGDTLSDFIDDVCGESRLRVEDDLGDGFVRLRSSEAERRQAAQDIRSSEDVVIELLRNARDAGASRIFLATQKTGNERLLTVLDDGQGIPAAQHERIFEPRVTSKLDSAHMDKWGMHGRPLNEPHPEKNRTTNDKDQLCLPLKPSPPSGASKYPPNRLPPPLPAPSPA